MRILSLLGCATSSVVIVASILGIADGQSSRLGLKSAEELVRSALESELNGNLSDRHRMLNEALATDPDYAPAHWHQGEILVEEEWVPLEQAVARYKDDDDLAAYRAQRDSADDSPASGLALAKWCRRQRLASQEHFHLVRVASDPRSSFAQRAQATERLRRLRIQGDSEAMNADDRRQRETARLLEKWRASVARSAKALQSPSFRQRQTAQESLLNIRDVHAIPAIEASLSLTSPQHGLLAVRILGNLSQVEGTVSLVRHALMAPWPSVAEAAAEELKDRPLHDFIPLLLAQLETPVQLNATTEIDDRGQQRRRYLFFREGIEANFLHLMDIVSDQRSVFRPSGMRNVGTVGLNPMLASVASSSPFPDAAAASQDPNLVAPEPAALAQMRARVQADNERIARNNARVFEVLEHVTYVVLPREPVPWWDWWQDYNEVTSPYSEDLKPTQVTYSQQALPVASAGTTSLASGSAQECFCAGTIVWTELGQVPIDTLRAGDRVLSQHPETGELSFQPVVERTVRPPTEIIRVVIDGCNEAILATRGHPFWVNGAGWRMAKQLRAGDHLHAVHGPMKILACEALPDEREAFNLVVAGTGTYFVGSRAILVHDNTYRAPTQSLVPGLPQSSQQTLTREVAGWRASPG